MRSGNPALSAGTFERFDVYEPAQTMTVNGTATKTFILLVLAVVPAVFTLSAVPYHDFRAQLSDPDSVMTLVTRSCIDAGQ